VTGITVSAPFHTFALDPMMVSDTAEQYKGHCETRARKFLGSVTSAAHAAGVACQVAHVMTSDSGVRPLRTNSMIRCRTSVGMAVDSSASWTPPPIGEQCPRKRVNSNELSRADHECRHHERQHDQAEYWPKEVLTVSALLAVGWLSVAVTVIPIVGLVLGLAWFIRLGIRRFGRSA
jgi:hypothetical protein